MYYNLCIKQSSWVLKHAFISVKLHLTKNYIRTILQTIINYILPNLFIYLFIIHSFIIFILFRLNEIIM